MRRDKISLSNRQIVANMILSDTNINYLASSVIEKFPIKERQQFLTILTNSTTIFSPFDAPTNTRLCATLLVNGQILNQASLTDLISVLLAPEPLKLVQATAIKESIKFVSTDYARRYLRNNGQSFVISTNGVNPISTVMKPIVDALNAPYCNGLESALRVVGVTIDDVDRTSLITWNTIWQNKVFIGDALPVNYIGKIMICLGTTNYNSWTIQYNGR